jgi:superfamily II DNA or RNA helicase
MAATTLRPYQAALVARAESEIIAERRRALIVAPTGSGKTVIAAALIAEVVATGGRVLVLAHRREIVAQTAVKLFDAGVTDHAVLQAGFPTRPSAPVQIASIQTLHARAVRSRSVEMPHADVVIVDEAHHAPARTYRRIIDAFPNAAVVGLTATPVRGDGRGLGGIFNRLIECPGVGELIDLGYLVPTRVYAPSRPDLTGVRVERGDYVESQLAARMDKPKLIGDVVEHWHRLSEGRRTVVFATSVAHSVHLRDEFRLSCVLAEHIDGSTPTEERDEILRRLAAGAVEVVCNCMVLTEGWDQPGVSCIVLARPTKQMGLYRQMVGRVLRPAPDKEFALVLDHAGAVFEHGFVEDPIQWTLDPDRRAESAVHAGRGHYGAPALITCPECHAVRFEGRPCSICGWRPITKPTPIVIGDGELGHVDRNGNIRIPVTDQVAFQRQLAWIARERGYRDGWVAHKYRERFGTWPTARSVEAMAPEPWVRSWVRSRQIAFAKSMATATRS